MSGATHQSLLTRRERGAGKGGNVAIDAREAFFSDDGGMSGDGGRAVAAGKASAFGDGKSEGYDPIWAGAV